MQRQSQGSGMQAKAKGVIGAITSQAEGGVVGWAVDSPTWWSRVRIDFVSDDRVLFSTPANLPDAILKANRVGDGNHGFFVKYDASQKRQIIEAGGSAKIIAVGAASRRELGQVEFSLPELNKNNAWVQKARQTHGDVSKRWAEALKDGALVRVDRSQHANPLYNRIFETQMRYRQIGGIHQAAVNNFLIFVHFKYSRQGHFKLVNDPSECVHMLNSFVHGYSRMPELKARRLPLSKQQIEYLNEPICFGSLRGTFPRVMWPALLEQQDFLENLKSKSINWEKLYSYWWAIDYVKKINAEDCLVPEYLIAQLCEVNDSWAGFDLPLTFFMMQYYNTAEHLKFLDINIFHDRVIFCCLLLLECIDRPDFLRYIPKAAVAFVLEQRKGKLSYFSNVLDFILNRKSSIDLNPETFAILIEQRGFDMDRMSFTTFSPQGDRLEAANLLRPSDGELIDLQIIGPHDKASGLGQATRMSVLALQQTKFKINCVDSVMDNPAPTGFNAVAERSKHKRAKINLIHINAESAPYVFAFEPDVFSDAYNIGYFFWELETPADAHFLALEMLDEVWVSTEYGVNIYKDHFKGPVTNVGLTSERFPNYDKAEGRKELNKKLGYDGSEFVVFATFDSFSFIQRKNPLAIVKAFKQAFPNDSNVRLVLKTQNRQKMKLGKTVEIWQAIEKIVTVDHRITILDETMLFTDLLKLKSGCDCYISLHRSEGWGFGMIEAMSLKVPVICTAYSGNLEFCKPETSWLVDYDMVDLEPEDYIYVLPGQKWADPKIDSAAAALVAIRENPDEAKRRAERAFDFVTQNFDLDTISARYGKRTEEILEKLHREKYGTA
jgi:glycosyltransferase involved in cell wall biosynthesis